MTGRARPLCNCYVLGTNTRLVLCTKEKGGEEDEFEGKKEEDDELKHA